MPKTGRQPYETPATITFGSGQSRLRPPPDLAAPERKAFLDIVTSLPPEHFQPADVPLVARWAELTVMIEQARGELAVSGMVTADGKMSPWFSIYQQSVKAMSGLCLRLRIGPQARAPKASKKTVLPTSYYERLALGDDDAAPEAIDTAAT